jgi:uncharacterized membrane protein
MRRIEITVDDADADRLKLEADQPMEYHSLVERTRRRAGQGMDRRQVEGIVAFVFSELAS